MTSDSPAFIRAFIAVEIDEETRRALAKTQGMLRLAGAHVAWVAPENIHVSMVFLGDTVADTIPRIIGEIDAAAAITTPFTFEVVALGTFGRIDAPRVIWAGVRSPEAIQALQGSIADGMRSLQIPLEARKFVPHLTLGRVKSLRGCRELADVIRSERETCFGRVFASRVVLMRSVLKPAGAEYSVLHEAKLAAT